MKSIMIIWLLIFPSPKLTFSPLKIGGKGRLDPASLWGFGPIWLLLGTVFYPRNSKMSSWPNDVTLPHEKIWSGTRTPNEQGGKPLGGWKWSPIVEDEDEEAVSLINPLWIHITWWCCYLTFIARKWKSSPKNVRSIYTSPMDLKRFKMDFEIWKKKSTPFLHHPEAMTKILFWSWDGWEHVRNTWCLFFWVK